MSEENDDENFVEMPMSPTEYEQLTQSIYQMLLQEQGWKNIEVKHNTRETGRSGVAHQIDVYWKFSVGGKEYKTYIECKHYKNPISLIHIRNFFGVLQDTGANGLFVTKVGYQSGAEKFASYYGIDTKIIKETAEEDLDGRIRKIQINLIAKTISNNPMMKVDLKFKQNEDIAWLKSLEKGSWSLSNSMQFFDAAKNPQQQNLKQIIESQTPVLGLTKGGPYQHSIKLQDHFLLVFEKLVQVGSVDIEYYVDEYNSSTTTRDALEIFTHILKDFKTGNIEFLKHRDGGGKSGN